jgi:hypothetical protein
MSLYRISNSAFSAILKLLTEAFPKGNALPRSYNEAKKHLKELGCAIIIVCCSERDMPNFTSVPFVVFRDGRMKKERKFHKRCCGIFH